MTKKQNKKKLAVAKVLNLIGTMLIVVGLTFLYLTFGPAIKYETTYQLTKNRIIAEEELVPLDVGFSIIIPKIGATALVFANVDPYNKDAYLPVLYKGIAHAKGTSFPDIAGNTYLFAHSTDAFYNVGRYNAVFYLLGKLIPGDEIEVYYHGKAYKYVVEEVKVVSADAIKYLSASTNEKVLTLQTCYPPGTTLKRLVVIAKQIEGE